MIRFMVPVAIMIVAGAALAHEGAHGIVAKRMDAMKVMQDEMKAIGEMLTGKQPINRAALQKHAQTLHDNCHMIGDMFPEGSTDPHSHAKPSIWTDQTAFAAEVTRVHEATESFLRSAKTADQPRLLASLKTISSACDSCHKTFRTPID